MIKQGYCGIRCGIGIHMPLCFLKTNKKLLKFSTLQRSSVRLFPFVVEDTPDQVMIDDVIVIDLSKYMNKVIVDGTLQVAYVEGGALLHDLDVATETHKLVVPSGQISHTGVAGLTLQGGFGYISRKWGLSCDNVISYEVVLANGEVIVVTKDTHQDLFWALKGAGHNFGVVTQFTFQLHSFPTFTSGTIIWPYERERARQILKLFNSIIKEASDDLCLHVDFTTLPNVGKSILLDISFVGDVASCEKALGDLLTYGTPLVKTIQLTQYSKKQQSLDVVTAHGQNFYNKDAYFDWKSDEIIDQIILPYEATTLPGANVFIVPLGGAIGRVSKESTAFAYRQSEYVLAVLAMYKEGEEQEALAWGRQYDQKKFFFGLYGTTEEISNHESTILAFGESNLPRLKEIKKKYDLENVFRYNFNISLN